MKNSHPGSFTRLNDVWAKDLNNVYCYGKPWPDLDAGTFEFLFTEYPTSYAKCANGLHDANGRRTVKGIDGASFSRLNNFWGKDSSNVYSFKTHRIQKQMDAATFEITDDFGGGRDKSFNYSLGPLSTIIKRKR